MLRKILKTWNRRRLEARRVRREHGTPPDFDIPALAHQLGLNLPVPSGITLAVALLDAGTEEGRFQHCMASIALACERLGPGSSFSIRLPKTVAMPPQHPLRSGRDAEEPIPTHHLLLSASCVLEPDSLANMLRMSASAEDSSAIEAAHFPDGMGRPFNPHTLDTSCAPPFCLLLPHAVHAQVASQACSALNELPPQRIVEEIAKAGVSTKLCHAALVGRLTNNTSAVTPAFSAIVPEETLSVLIRFHDASRLAELKRCLFSIANSTYPALEAVVICQNIDLLGVTSIRAYGELLSRIRPITLTVSQPDLPQGADCRSRLLNTGMAESSGRYIAFLDYDDCIYPDAYRLLIETLRRTQSTIAFGDIRVTHVDAQESFVLIRRQSKGWGARSLADLMHDNCCPIHSYVFDRSRFIGAGPQFDESLSKYEDYDFLLQLCAVYPCTFEASTVTVGDYYIKDDGSNTVINASSYTPEARAEWERSKDIVLRRRDATLISDAVRQRLDVDLSSARLPALPSPCSIGQVNHRARALRKLEHVRP